MARTTNLNLPIEELPRERALKVGFENLSNMELIAIMLGTGTHSMNVLDTSKVILNAYNGKLDQLLNADVEDLQKQNGIGKAKALQLKACFELSKRIHISQLSKKEDYYFKTASNIADYFMPLLRFQRQEYLMCAYLNARGKVLKTETISIGNIEGSFFYPREVFRGAISSSATSLVLVHNHPSGDSTPSDKDMDTSKRLKDVGNILGISIMDHVIIGDGTFASLKEMKIL